MSDIAESISTELLEELFEKDLVCGFGGFPGSDGTGCQNPADWQFWTKCKACVLVCNTHKHLAEYDHKMSRRCYDCKKTFVIVKWDRL